MRRPYSNDSDKITKEVFKSPARLVISLILVILVIDIGITFLLKALPIYYNKLSGLIDGLALIILIGPALYFLVFRPLLYYVVKSTRLQQEDQVLYEITEGVTSTSNLNELLKLIHTSISKVLYAENCFFALYDHEKGRFSFPYFIDKYDAPPEEDLPLEKSCTAYIFRSGKSELIPGDVFKQLAEEGEVELVGSFSPSWVGIPLRTSSKIIGVLVLQHYEKEDIYDEGHLRFLDSIASQVANVIERKRAEEELEKSFSLLTATLEATADGLVVVDKSKKITHYNSKFFEMWKVPLAILDKKDDAQLRAFLFSQLKNSDKFLKITDDIYNDEERTSLDFLECIDGRVFERYSQPQRLEGKAIGRVWSFRDITERRKAERELQGSEEKFRTFFEKSPIGIEIYDAKGIQIDINNTALEIFGIAEKKDSLGFDLFSGTSLNDELKDKLLRGEQIDYTVSFDFEKVKKLNQYGTSKQGEVEVHYSITPLKSNDKVVLGYLMLIQDITERLKTEKDLREKENRYRTLFESANDAIFIMGHEHFVNCNQMTLKIFECSSKDDFIGHTPWEFSPQYQPDGKSSELSAKARIEDALDGIPQHFYWRHITKNGRMFDAEVTLHRVEVDGAFYLQAVVRDVTERKKAQDMLKESEVRLRELNASKDKFFSIIAHDLKNPFNAIIGFSDLLAEKIKDKDYDGIEELTDLIQKSSERTFALLMNLLEWARSQTGRVKFEPEMLNVNHMIKESTEALQDIAAHKSIDITVKTHEGDTVFADRDMTSTILRNLVSNALKFTGVGGKIDISAVRENGHVLMKVKDNGVGIDKENQDKLFRIDESYSNPGTLNEKGTGLGLLICKEFIEKNGGSIWVESEPGKGSTFNFTLPSKG
ncbi:MAG: PAS domain S-box protein [Bacteroidales bacterium]|nr:PAS domain S-box protein [Bacteroidales bacterium]